MLNIPYGRGHLTLNATPDWVLCPREEEAPRDGAALVGEALRQPIASPGLRALVREAAPAERPPRVLVLTSDHTRPVPSDVTLPPMLAEIRQARPDAQIKILVATGMHRAPTEQEMLDKFGEALLRNETFLCHDSRDEEAMVFKGRLPSGGALWVNGLVDWADLTISDGFIEPHFFAGFSGGRKSVLPGIASYRTVLYNHNAAFVADPASVQGNLDGNPIDADMRFAARVAGLRFILNVLLDSQKRIVAAYAGDPEQAHAKGCAECLARCRVEAVEADIVVTSNGGYPLDQNLYQAVKGMTAGEACLGPGGVLIMVSQCEDGHGGEAFCRMMEADAPERVYQSIADIPAEETTPDQWQAQILARVLLRATVIMVTEPQNRSFIEAMHLRYAASLDEALDLAHSLCGKPARLCVIPDGVGVVVQKP